MTRDKTEMTCGMREDGPTNERGRADTSLHSSEAGCEFSGHRSRKNWLTMMNAACGRSAACRQVRHIDLVVWRGGTGQLRERARFACRLSGLRPFGAKGSC
jgi:hypothetical protein